MSYEKDTKNAYRNQEKANAYKNQYIEGFKWARFTMWRQKKIIKTLIHNCSFKETDSILDAPCGAGYIGDLLSELDSKSQLRNGLKVGKSISLFLLPRNSNSALLKVIIPD